MRSLNPNLFFYSFRGLKQSKKKKKLKDNDYLSSTVTLFMTSPCWIASTTS